MENIKQKIVLPTRGVCNTTPDPICEDNEMEDCVGLTFSDDAIRPIQAVKLVTNEVPDGYKVVRVHDNGVFEHYICVKPNVSSNSSSSKGFGDSKPANVITIYMWTDERNHTILLPVAELPVASEVSISIALRYMEQNEQQDGSIVWEPVFFTDTLHIPLAEVRGEKLDIEAKYPTFRDIELGYIPSQDVVDATYHYTILTDVRHGEPSVDPTKEQITVVYNIDYKTGIISVTADKPVASVLNMYFKVKESSGNYTSVCVVINAGTYSSAVPFADSSEVSFTSIVPSSDALYTYVAELGTITYKDEEDEGDSPEPVDPSDEGKEVEQKDIVYFFTLDGSVPPSNPQRLSTLTESFVVIDVEAVGNTLIVNTDIGLMYYIWKADIHSYVYLGKKLPEPDVEFRMEEGIGYISDNKDPELINEENAGDDDEGSWLDFLIGAYERAKKKAFHEKMFVLPFFLRYGIELYDGTYCMLSNPIPFFPSVRKPLVHGWYEYSIGGKTVKKLRSLVFGRPLKYKINSDLSEWSDIIKGITLFVTKPVELVEKFYSKKTVRPDGDYPVGQLFPDQSVYLDGIYYKDGMDQFIAQTTDIKPYPDHDYGDQTVYSYSQLYIRKSSDIENDMKSSSVFYKLCDIGSHATDDFMPTSARINESVLENITTQTFLHADNNSDYYSHCQLHAGIMKTFNRRLNIAPVKRSFFDGFGKMVYYNKYLSETSQGISKEDLENNYFTEYRFYVTIETADGLRVVVKKADGILDNIYTWFYYPDPRAKKVAIYGRKKTTPWQFINELPLEEHHGLNGAFYYHHPSPDDARPTGTSFDSFPKLNYTPENLSNYLLQSEVDNPFLFKASGYVRVGQGIINGIAGLTTALNQDAYKVATTIIFTTQGIWALEIDKEGVYSSVQPPYSREVSNNTKAITMIDSGVFFTSERGLMMITDKGVQCISEQLRGKDVDDDIFRNFLLGCVMAYDYRDSLLWLINPSYSYHWAVNLRSFTITRIIDDKSYKSVFVNYPDSMLQDMDSNLYSLIKKPNINSDDHIYSGFFITRPMKFEQAMALKSLRDLKHIKDMNADAEITLTILASNDCTSWQQLPSLKGRGFKYFKFKYEFENMKAADAFCGTVLYYTTRLTDRIR